MVRIDVHVPDGGWALADVTSAVKASGIDVYFDDVSPGPFGHTTLSLASLEALVLASDLAWCSADELHGVIIEELKGGEFDSFVLPMLEPEHTRLVNSFMVIVLADAFRRRVGELAELPDVDGELDTDGLDLLLELEDRGMFLERVLRLARAYVEMRVGHDESKVADKQCAQGLVAFLMLFRRATIRLARSGGVRALVRVLEEGGVRVAGYPYDGLEIRALRSEGAGLLPIQPNDIVGNKEYLEAGIRLARDVAGYDFESRSNPKRINPILFGLGRPGCGKTVTAHAVGNDFLEFCAARDIPAKFVVVRRTDWASSYQNASAVNLVRLFREEVYGFDGVCGVYWPDIDTAFASRANDNLRSEEKQNLGAVFGVFDGTLLPKDGKWFLICDANNLHMDEATISRIAQNPFTVAGPTEPAHFVTLMRDVMLKDVGSFLPADESEWTEIGEICVEQGLSGRNVDSICGNIRAWVQDFEYPDEYFTADSEGRRQILASLGRHCSKEKILDFIEDFSAFRKEAERRSEEERFDREVDAIVRHLNASRAAAHRAAGSGE